MPPVFMWQTPWYFRRTDYPWQHADLSSLPTENGEKVWQRSYFRGSGTWS